MNGTYYLSTCMVPTLYIICGLCVLGSRRHGGGLRQGGIDWRVGRGRGGVVVGHIEGEDARKHSVRKHGW